MKKKKEPNPSPEQEAILKEIESGHNVFITGSAGTGKSFLLKHIIEYFKKHHKTLAVCGSTGIAAVNVGGVTLHSWAGIGLATEPVEEVAKRLIQSESKGFRNIKTIDHLAIDEISMISASLLDYVNELFQIIRKSDKPFGGMQIITFGDFLQLPPVSNDEKLERFAFHAESWKAAQFRCHVLKKVFRQEDQEFAECLNSVRKGIITPQVSAILNECYKRKDAFSEINPVILHTHNKNVDAINIGRLNGLDGELMVYGAIDSGSPRGRKVLEKCILPERLELKEGAQVMLCVNLDVGNGLANGSLGIVTDFEKSFSRRVPVVKFSNGHEQTIDFHRWEVRENSELIAERMQIPLRLAWAITAHKSQGMTLDKVVIHLAGVFEYGQAYVMLSRAKSKEGLFIANGNKQCIRAHPDALKFYEEIEQ